MTVTREIITQTLMLILKENAPVRGENAPMGKPYYSSPQYLRPTKLSPYPGNLKNNGIYAEDYGGNTKVSIGGAPAPYAVYTESTSFKPGWMEKSNKEFLQKLQNYGGRIL